MSSGSACLFDFLHAEIIKYVKEQEDSRVHEQCMKLINNSEEPVSNRVYQLLHEGYSRTIKPEARIKKLGYRVGFVLAEKLARNATRLTTELETVKFICKEFWSTAFGKQADSLRTNHQGTYFILDNRMSILLPFAEGKQYLEKANIYLVFPTELIRGALANLGYEATVSSTVENLPSVKFNLQVKQVPRPIPDELTPLPITQL